MSGRPRRHSGEPPAGSGINPDTGEWTPAFPGQRPPLPVGHAIRETHGAYLSPARLSEETQALAVELAPLVPGYSPSDSVAVELLALTLRRIARAEPVVAAAEDAGDPDAVERLQRAQRGWVNSATRLLDLLAMMPGSRARLGLDVARLGSELGSLAEAGRAIRLAEVPDAEEAGG